MRSADGTRPDAAGSPAWLEERFAGDGATVAAIAAELGQPARRVASQLRELGIHRRPAGQRLWEALTDGGAVAALVESVGLFEAAAALGAKESAVRGALGTSQGIDPGPGWLHHHYVVEGLSLGQIGEKLGLSKERVRERLVSYELGVEDQRAAQLGRLDRDSLRVDYEAGRPVADIARGAGVGVRTVRDVVDEDGLTRTRVWERALTREFLEAEYVQAGRSLRSIADQVGLASSQVREAMIAWGIPRRARMVRKVDVPDAELRELLETFTAPQLAARFGVTREAIYQHMDRLGVRRPRR